jgi:hypothetical protein
MSRVRVAPRLVAVIAKHPIAASALVRVTGGSAQAAGVYTEPPLASKLRKPIAKGKRREERGGVSLSGAPRTGSLADASSASG